MNAVDMRVLVTGGSHGLGQAIIRRLQQEGARVVCCSRTSPHYIGERFISLPVDVRCIEQVESMMMKIREYWGGLDVLINNAALMAGERAMAELAPDVWHQVIDTNLNGCYHCCYQGIPLMGSQGIIINLTSGAAVRAGFLNIAYGVSKAAIDRLTFGVAAESILP